MNHEDGSPDDVLRFEAFRLDGTDMLTRRNGNGGWERVVLGSRALAMLRALAAQRGGLITKQALMDAGWPGRTVEDSNLSVQMSALRRVLDVDRTEGSCIQTVIGRGYRFLPAVTVEPPAAAATDLPDQGTVVLSATATDVPDAASVVAASVAETSASGMSAAALSVAGTSIPETSDTPHGPLPRRPASPRIIVTSALILVGLGAAGLGAAGWLHRPPSAARQQASPAMAPRLSIVVLPFANLSGDPAEDYLADGVTDDLTNDLAHIPEAVVIGTMSARAHNARAGDAKQTGRELGVRYVVKGSVRRTGETLRVIAELISTETGAQVWSGRFDESIADLAAGQDAILARMRGTLGVSLIDVEVARGRRAPPSSPDAFDLILRARALRNLPYDRRVSAEALSLYEQALQLDPSSVHALAGAAAMLIDVSATSDGWRSSESRQRVAELLTRARDIAPASEEYRGVYVYWLSVEGGCQQAMPAARYMVETYSNPTYGPGILATCLIQTGHSDQAIPVLERALRVNPLGPNLFQRFSRIGSAHVYLGQYAQAIPWLERAMAVQPSYRDNFPGGLNRKLAVAYAGVGQTADARRALATADRDWPFDTVRGHWPDNINPVFAAQIRAFQESLRRLGERDHADEDADFGVSSDAGLRTELIGKTPTTAPGARTIRTADLVPFMAERKPLIVDPLLYFWGDSIPGAVGLRGAGMGGTVTDETQERLGRKMAQLTSGDRGMPIVAVGWNSERFDGHNLALRLVALGYTNVLWYRGGREAWEAAGLPETDLMPQSW